MADVITAVDLRSGSTFERGGELYQVVDFQHVKQARGSAFVRVKFRNLITGAVTEETFRPEERLGRVRVERTDVQYLYRDGDHYVVMDLASYDQVPLTAEQLGDAVRFLKENETLGLLRHQDRVLGVELPVAVELAITRTEPGFRGDTANAATKPATLETGLTVDVPLFVNEGELIRVDTRTGRYLERVQPS